VAGWVGGWTLKVWHGHPLWCITDGAPMHLLWCITDGAPIVVHNRQGNKSGCCLGLNEDIGKRARRVPSFLQGWLWFGSNLGSRLLISQTFLPDPHARKHAHTHTHSLTHSHSHTHTLTHSGHQLGTSGLQPKKLWYGHRVQGLQ